MTTDSHQAYLYAGLAGETAPGRVVQSGLYRMAVGGEEWESITNGLPEAPAIRAIATTMRSARRTRRRWSRRSGRWRRSTARPA